MKLAILLALFGFVAMQMVEGTSYQVYYQYPTRSYSSSSSYVSSYLKKTTAYYHALALAKSRLQVTSTTENYCSRIQACTSGDSNCQTINQFMQKVCSEGGLVYYIMRRVMMPSLLSETDCKVARLITCSSWNCQVVCNYLQNFIGQRCPAQEPVEEEAEDPMTGNPPATDAPATEAPATEAPATEAPATEAPIVATEAPTPMPAVTTAPPLFK